MKYLSDYMQDKQTALFNKCGAFFAFSNKQLEGKIKKNVKYVNLSGGMICPSENAKELIAGLEAIHIEAVKQDLAENGAKAIIHRELANHECQIGMDYSEVTELMEPYGITPEQVAHEWTKYWDKCIENDWF